MNFEYRKLLAEQVKKGKNLINESRNFLQIKVSENTINFNNT